MKFNSRRGFTVIELLVVIGLIAVLAGVLVVLVNPVGQLQKSRDARRKVDIRQIQSALELYRADQLAYPDASALATCGVSLTGSVNGSTVTYISKIPCDPKGGVYVYAPDGPPALNYTLKACLENASDPDQDAKNGGPNSCVSPYYSYTLQNP